MANYEYLTQYDSPNYTRGILSLLRFGRKRTIKGITIHHWGVRGQSFMGVVRYLCRAKGNTSAHEVIMAGRVAVIVDHKNVAWHSGNGKGNATTIGLELRPESTEADYVTAAERIADLRETYGNIPLIPHRSWKATACPGDWSLAKLDRMANQILAARKVGAVAPAAKPKPSAPAPAKPKPAAKPAPKPAAGGSVVNWLASEGRASSFTARAKLAAQYGIKGYKGTAAQNTALLAKLQANAPKAKPKPIAKPKPKKGTRLHLPKTVSKWGIYKLNHQPVKRNVFAYLNPKKFGGLTYDIVRWTVPNQVAVIKTSQFGQVQIYVAKSTGAVIK